ncbi:MAG TPA: ABC transporter permease [Blastocatellia bacterium]|nr:ABC transporter permease [Blastocatellia bacterium]
METLWHDLRYGVRMLRRRPGFTAVAVIALALGIGANTAIFSVVYGVLLRPLPYKDAERIVIASISPPDFRDLKEANQVFDQMAIWASNLYNVNTGGEVSQVLGAVVSPEFFPMLGNPLLGRVFRPEEDRTPLAVISHDFWQSRYGGEQDAIGKTIRLSGKVYTIIGVMPPEFQYPNGQFKLWVTFNSAMDAAPGQAENRQLRIFRAVAHLKPGVTAARMQDEIASISLRLQQQYPKTNSGVMIEFRSLPERILGDVRRALWVLLGTVGFVLLIACANVANLTLARTAAREREIAIRTAMGAGRWRVMRQLLTESLLLAGLGGALGLLLAMWGIDVLPGLSAGNIPRLTTVGINTRVLLFTLGASMLTGILFGLVPAWQATRGGLNQSLREGGRGAFGSVRGRRLRGALVVAEVALSLVVLIGAGLLIRSFTRLLEVERGFVTDNLLTLNVGLVDYKDPQRRAAISHDLVDRIARVPGVEAVGAGTGLPPVTPQRGTRFAVEGLPNDNADERSSYFIAVSPDYFRALGTPLVEGRAFNERDAAGAAKVVIINRALARRLFPNESAIGKRLQLVNPDQSNDWRDIVGVVGDVRYSGLDDPGEAAVYTPFAQTPFIWNYLMVRTSVAPESVIQAVRNAVASVEPNLEAANFQTMNRLVSESVAQPRFYTLLLGAFALLALVLAAVGIYGVISYSVTQRTHEIGLRMALGAQTHDVLKLVVRQGMVPALAGTGVGLVASFGLTRLMTSLLFNVSATDPVTFAIITALLIGVALAACWVPARRAMKVDPMEALRYE